jgi:uncharacterized repeat protein (TIGR01451 family)
VGEPVTWTYNITNTGNVELTAVSLVDSVEGPIACPTTLAKGASMTCEKTGIAEEGQYSNLATVTAKPPEGFDQVSASDPSHYYGSDAGVSITKLTNGVDIGETGRPYILVGEQVTWTYLITNIGNVQINNIKVSDSDPSLTINCESTTLAPDALMTCTALGTAIKGEYTNTGYVEATPLGFEEKVQDSDNSAYFGAEPAVAITKYTNGEDAKEPTGPYIPVGEPVNFTLEISDTETGHFDSEIAVVDDSDLGAEEAIVTDTPGEGTASTTDRVGGMGAQSSMGVDMAESEESDDSWAASSTLLARYANQAVAAAESASNPRSVDNVFWEYVITNTGNVTLTGISVVDDQGVTVVCPKTTLAVGESMTCTASGQAEPGQYANIGTVSGVPPVGLNVTDSDISHYFGSAPEISLVKKLNGVRYTQATQPYLSVGTPINWTYEVENMGNVTLENITVVDDLGADGTLQEVCTIKTLAVGAKDTTSCALADDATIGQYENTATVSGTPPVGSDATDSDKSFYFGADPQVEVEFRVNGVDADSGPGLFVVADSTITLDYVVTNTGNVALSSLLVSDSLGYTCNIASLAAGATDTDTCRRIITAEIGQQSATATVTGTPPGELTSITSDPDPINYFGATLNLTMVKKTNGQVVSAPSGLYVETGSTVNWTYELTNESNVTLTNIRVVDDNGTPGLGDDHTVCSGITLNPGITHTCTWSQPAKAGAYTNTATATADPPAPLDEVETDATSHYFGVSLNVSFVKRTNGEDAKTGPGPYIATGDPVEWTYTVTNNSNVTLTGISVVDDQQDVIVDCEEVTALNPGEDMTCSASGAAVAGQYANTATLTAVTPGDLDNLTQTDTSHYFGVVTGIEFEKRTNGIDAKTPTGPLIKIGSEVTWTYVVKNTSNITLTNIVVTDDQEGAISCPSTSLAPNAIMTCSATGIAIEGQYANEGTVTAATSPAEFGPLTASDPSHYYGSEAGVAITKLTNGVDIDEDPVPFILVGDPVNWTYVVTNVGNVLLENIIVTDSDEDLAIDCGQQTTLAVGDSLTCTASGTAIKGAYTNTGYVEATPLGFEDKVQATADSAYYGAEPSITIVKYTNGEDAQEPTGPYIPVGEPVAFTYQISTQDTLYVFSEITVTDDTGVTVTCPTTTFAPGDDPIVCTASGTAALGQQNLAGHVTAKVTPVTTGIELGTVEASDPSHYFGYTLGLDLVKRTNGQIVTEPPGPGLSIGSTVTWTYEVINTSNVPLTDVAVSDDPEGQITCPTDEVAPGSSVICLATGTVIEGEYSNSAQASAKFEEITVESPVVVSHYVGVTGFYYYLPLILR